MNIYDDNNNDRKRAVAKLPQESGSTPLPASEREWGVKETKKSHTLPQVDTMPDPSGYTTKFGAPTMGMNSMLDVNDMWRYPELEEMSDRITDDIVEDLPQRCDDTISMKEQIRLHGLYGIRGRTDIDLLRRSKVSDQGYIQPLNARESWINYISQDQLHSRDQYLIPINKKK